MKVLLSLTLLFCALISVAQNDSSSTQLDSHIDHHNHFGLATGPVYILNESEFAPGLHLHYMRLIEAGNGHFGVGLGLEAIFD